MVVASTRARTSRGSAGLWLWQARALQPLRFIAAVRACCHLQRMPMCSSGGHSRSCIKVSSWLKRGVWNVHGEGNIRVNGDGCRMDTCTVKHGKRTRAQHAGRAPRCMHGRAWGQIAGQRHAGRLTTTWSQSAHARAVYEVSGRHGRHRQGNRHTNQPNVQRSVQKRATHSAAQESPRTPSRAVRVHRAPGHWSRAEDRSHAMAGSPDAKAARWAVAHKVSAASICIPHRQVTQVGMAEPPRD